MEKQKNLFLLENDEPFDIPEEGSLGLLAMGARGIIAWRRKREASKKKTTIVKNNKK